MHPSSSLNFILAYSDTETVKLDFDKTLFHDVKHWADRVSQRFKLEGYVVLKSSQDSYHIVFNRSVTWTENLKIVAWVCLHSHHNRLLKWFFMQCIKGSSTLRVGPKGEKPPPRVVLRCGKEDSEVKSFLHYRRSIKNALTFVKQECSKASTKEPKLS